MHKFIFKLIFINLIYCNLVVSFKNLTDAIKYGEQIEENTLVNYQDLLNPNYKAIYKKLQPSLTKRILYNVGIDLPALWSAVNFKQLLTELTQKRENEGYRGETISLINANPGTEIIIFGTLSSAFHSLVRSLLELKNKKIIDNNFNIIKPDVYIVFNGDIVNGSPYVLETLSLVMQLMVKNPENVLYVKGKQEDKEYWRNFEFKRELIAKAGYVSSQKIPLNQYLERFFKTLDSAVYVFSNNPDQGLIRISYFGRSQLNIDESKCFSLMKQQQKKVIVCKLDINQKEEKRPVVSAIIKAEKRMINLENYSGLALLEPDQGAVAWSTFSSPTIINQQIFKFFYDSFAVLKVGKNLNNSVITVYFQDVRDKTGYRKGKDYFVTSGQDVATVQSDSGMEPLIIGCTMDFEKGAIVESKQLRVGMSLRINKQNLEGGINGRPIKIVYMNDAYTPELARKNVIEFLKEYKSTIMMGNAGSPTLEAYVDLVKDKKVFIFFPTTAAPMFRRSDLTNLVHWSVSYKSEAFALTEYLIKNEIKVLAFLYQNDAFGLGCLEGSRLALKKYKIDKSLEMPYERNKLEFKEQIAELKNSNAQGLGFFSTSSTSKEFIIQAGVELLRTKSLVGNSDLSDKTLKKFLKQKGLKMVIANFLPNIETSNLEFIRECIDLAHEAGESEIDPIVVKGFLDADLFIFILKQIKGEITHEKIHNVIKNIKNLDYKGLLLNYNPETQELSNKLWLDTGEEKWLEVEVK